MSATACQIQILEQVKADKSAVKISSVGHKTAVGLIDSDRYLNSFDPPAAAARSSG